MRRGLPGEQEKPSPHWLVLGTIGCRAKREDTQDDLGFLAGASDSQGDEEFKGRSNLGAEARSLVHCV